VSRLVYDWRMPTIAAVTTAFHPDERL